MHRLFFVACFVVFSAGGAWAASSAEVARGKYIFGAAAGCGCHTEAKGPPNAGGKKFEGPFGTVYATTTGPDRETGIGDRDPDRRAETSPPSGSVDGPAATSAAAASAIRLAPP